MSAVNIQLWNFDRSEADRLIRELFMEMHSKFKGMNIGITNADEVSSPTVKTHIRDETDMNIIQVNLVGFENSVVELGVFRDLSIIMRNKIDELVAKGLGSRIWFRCPRMEVFRKYDLG